MVESSAGVGVALTLLALEVLECIVWLGLYVVVCADLDPCDDMCDLDVEERSNKKSSGKVHDAGKGTASPNSTESSVKMASESMRNRSRMDC